VIAQSISTANQITFFKITPSSVLSKWHGESEALVRILFETARHYAPSVIFIDEIDALMSNRSEDDAAHVICFKNELLTKID
jgi:SpoVK/Ycf46/Vps4 family AAA+-type ATPase